MVSINTSIRPKKRRPDEEDPNAPSTAVTTPSAPWQDDRPGSADQRIVDGGIAAAQELPKTGATSGNLDDVTIGSGTFDNDQGFDEEQNDRDIREGISNGILENLTNETDTAGREQAIRDDQEAQLGMGLMNARSRMGRAGFTGGSEAALEADARAGASRQTMDEIFGMQDDARQADFDRFLGAAGLDIGEQEQANRNARTQAAIDAMNALFGGDDPDAAPPSPEDVERVNQLTDSVGQGGADVNNTTLSPQQGVGQQETVNGETWTIKYYVGDTPVWANNSTGAVWKGDHPPSTTSAGAGAPPTVKPPGG